jgi:hypothetical protein
MIAALPQMAAKPLEERRPSQQPSGGGAEFAATLAAALAPAQAGRTGTGAGAAPPAAEAAAPVAQPQSDNALVPQDAAPQDETNPAPDAASAEADAALAAPAPQPLAAPAPPAGAATASVALAVPFVMPQTVRAEAARRPEGSGLSGADAITDGGGAAGLGWQAAGAAAKAAGAPQAAATQAADIGTAATSAATPDAQEPGLGADAAPRTARGAMDLPGAVPTGPGAAAEPLPGADSLPAAQPVQQPEPSLRGTAQPGAAQPAALLVPPQQDQGGRSLTPTAAPPEPPRPAAPPSAQPDRGAIGFASDPARQSFDLRLDTSTLGKVEVEVRQAGGAAEVVVRTERPDTLMALARDGADLDRALRDAGIGPEGRSMSFQLGSGGDGEAGQRQRGPGARLTPADQMQGNGASGPYRSPLSLIDIHV